MASVMNGRLPFNRTILELKLKKMGVARVSDLPFNRTILELKLYLFSFHKTQRNSFNRTILELKQPNHNHGNKETSLLIEPYWN